MALFDDVFTNILWNGEVAGSDPDAEGDYYLITDAQVDRNYMESKLWDTLMAMGLPSATSEIGAILFGGVVSDGGTGTINISEGVALAYDEAGNKRIVHIPALTGVALPSGWNNDRQIWVTAKYDFKLGSATRAHRAVGTTYHYQLNDTYMGDSSGYVSTGTTDLFTDADPTATDVVLGSFKMNGTTYADQNVRNAGFFSGGGGMPSNTALGASALGANTTGVSNTALGYEALGANTIGSYNTALGYEALGANTIGSYNTALGYRALVGNTTGIGNTALGYRTLEANTIGTNNTALGNNALLVNTTGANNTAIGHNALSANTTGTNNTALGYRTLEANTIGTNNTALGRDALFANTTGTSNTAIGHNALDANTTGSNNTAIGTSALGWNTTGVNNTAIGYNALGVNTTGINNVAIGYNAGDSLTTGSNNVCLGHNSDASLPTVSNEITLGNSSTAALRCNAGISALSDMRDKADIIPSSIGLNFINDLKPSVYKWDKREWYDKGTRDGSKKEDKLNLGFIAQDLDEIQKKYNAEFLKLVYFSNPEKLETTAVNLLPVMVKAIQDLSKKIDEQQIEIDSLKALQG